MDNLSPEEARFREWLIDGNSRLRANFYRDKPATPPKPRPQSHQDPSEPRVAAGRNSIVFNLGNAAGETIELMPGGWKMSQMQAEQPATTYAEFKHEILNEIARCLNLPFNVAAGNSSGYNYASGRLDHQTYFKSLRVDQSHLERVVLDRVLAAWLDEAVLIPGLLPAGLGPIADWPHQWFWDGQEHVDPAKEATAQATRLANNTTTLAYEYARQGRDWEDALNQRAKEIALMNQLGLPFAPAAQTQSQKPPTEAPSAANDDEFENPADAE